MTKNLQELPRACVSSIEDQRGFYEITTLFFLPPPVLREVIFYIGAGIWAGSKSSYISVSRVGMLTTFHDPA